MTSYRIRRISLTGVSAYLLYTPERAMLVDSGKKGSEVRILEELSRTGVKPSGVRLLVLTHAHYDHAGAASRIKELTGCRIVVHRDEAGRLRSGSTPIPGGTRWKAKAVAGLGRVFARRLMRYRGIEPDITVENELDLRPFGFPGFVRHTPGHTPGSVVVWMEGGELLAGDTLFGLAGKEHFPPFAEDSGRLLESWEKVRDYRLERIFPAHGGAIDPKRWRDEIPRAREKYG